MKKKFEFRKLSKVKEEAHDKEIIRSSAADVLKEETAAAEQTRESTCEVTKDTAHKGDGHEELL